MDTSCMEASCSPLHPFALSALLPQLPLFLDLVKGKSSRKRYGFAVSNSPWRLGGMLGGGHQPMSLPTWWQHVWPNVHMIQATPSLH